jgi:hypothetical protein
MNPVARTGTLPPVVVACSACGKPNRIPVEAMARLRCGACRIEFAHWLRDALSNPSPDWRRAAVPILASLYESSLFPLLAQALEDEHTWVRAAAWKVLIHPRSGRTETGDSVTLSRLYDRISTPERAALRARVPRLAELNGSEAETRATGDSGGLTGATPQVRGMARNNSFAAGSSEIYSGQDGLTLADLGAEARLLAQQVGDFD